MINRILIYIFVSLVYASAAQATIPFVDGRWETTYDCAPWVYGDTWVGCDDIDSPTYLPVCTDLNEEITSNANNPNGLGGLGQRHWVGDGVAVNTSGTNIRFDVAQTELWIRFYMRYQSGWMWNTMEQHKLIYMKTANGNDAVFKFDNDTAIEVISLFTSENAFPQNQNYGWSDVMGGASGDGTFHCYEIHLKADTNGTDGVGRIWVDGVLQAENTECNWFGGVTLGWTYFNIGSNQATPDNGDCVYLDYDDIVIYNTTPPNTDADGNAYIGPIETGTTVTLPADFSTSENPTTYTGTATAPAGETITGVVSSNSYTVTPDDGAWDEQTEPFTVSGVIPTITDTCTATSSDASTGNDSITITLAGSGTIRSGWGGSNWGR